MVSLDAGALDDVAVDAVCDELFATADCAADELGPDFVHDDPEEPGPKRCKHLQAAMLEQGAVHVKQVRGSATQPAQRKASRHARKRAAAAEAAEAAKQAVTIAAEEQAAAEAARVPCVLLSIQSVVLQAAERDATQKPEAVGAADAVADSSCWPQLCGNRYAALAFDEAFEEADPEPLEAIGALAAAAGEGIAVARHGPLHLREAAGRCIDGTATVDEVRLIQAFFELRLKIYTA